MTRTIDRDGLSRMLAVLQKQGYETIGPKMESGAIVYGEVRTAEDFPSCFCIFNGDSWTVYGLYLIPQEIGIGRFQPYVRFTSIDPRYSDMRQEFEYGVNYVISGHNARVSAFGRYGDIATMGGDYSSNVAGNKVDSFHVALQLQY